MEIKIGRTKSPKKNPKEKFKVTLEFMGGDADTEHFETLNATLDQKELLEKLLTDLDEWAKKNKYNQRDADIENTPFAMYVDGYNCDETPEGMWFCWPNDPQCDYQFRTSYEGVSKIQYFDCDGIEKSVTIK